MSIEILQLGSAPLEIIDGDRGKNYPHQNELLDEGHCLFLSATNVTKDGFLFDSCQFITESKDDALRKGKVQRNDVILTTRGTLGNVAYYSEDVPFEHVRINSGMVTIKTDPEKLRPRYLYYFLKSSLFQSQVRALQSGAAQPQLPIRDIKKIKIPILDLGLQEKIANTVGAYDDLIENNRRRIALLEEAARLLYREWFVYLRFPGREHVKIADGIPEGWSRHTLVNFATVRKGKNITKETVNPGTVPVVAGGLNPAYFHDVSNARGPVITVSASGANSGYVNLYYSDIWASDCSYFSGSDNPQIFLLYCLLKAQQAEITAMQKGAAQPHVYPKDLERLNVLWPNEVLRSEFTQIVGPQFEQIRRLQDQVAALVRARDLLLPHLMDGKIEV